MGIFRRGGEAKKNNGINEQATGWENMGDPYGDARAKQEAIAQREEANRLRRERKLIAAFAYRQGEQSDTSFLNQYDVRISNEMRNAVVADMASGAITRTQEKELLECIALPSDFQGGFPKTMSKLGTKHEKRILARMSSAGFSNWNRVSEANLQEFLYQYPTPMDFDNAAQAFIDEIEYQNGPQKRSEYEEAMASFRKKVYGKREDYWQCIRGLENEAYQYNANKANGVGTPQRTGYRGFERERSAEWQPGEAACWQTSRIQAREGKVTKYNIERGLWAGNTCEDSYFMRPDQQMYGVFDGAGGEHGGRNASQMTADVVREYSDQYLLESGADLAYVLNAASARVANNPEAGFSTAVLAKVVKHEGRLKLAYASVGDSRIYIVDKNGKAHQITRDEGEGRFISNAIGREGVPDGALKEGESRTKQFGEIELHKGDRVVLCSDGITGDYGDDIMSDRELGFIVSHSNGSMDAAKNLVANARKKDDRTAIVFGEF